MQLEDNLCVCLMALASRYPHHTIDINHRLLDLGWSELRGWKAPQVIQFLETAAPNLLHTPASIVINLQKSEIYLLNYSEYIPALLIHCNKDMPVTRSTSLPRT